MPTRFAPLAPDDPREVGGYVLRARLGAGGMGRVYLGFTPGGRALAIKVIRPEHADDEEFRRRFEHEVAAAQRVQGLFTAPVVDADPKAPLPWLATAYVPGPSLRQAVADHGPLPLPTVFRLVAGVAEGLAAVHASGVIHRDLTPANVLLAADGPRVIDFGIAHAAAATSLTRTGVQVGTPAFMAPEQVLGRQATPATDVFAIGHLAVFAATGRPAFGEGNQNALLYRIANEPPDLDDCPDELRAIAGRCLAKEPAERPELTEIVDHARARTRGHTLQLAGSWLPTAIADSLTFFNTTAYRPDTAPRPSPPPTRVSTAPTPTRPPPKPASQPKPRTMSLGDRFLKSVGALTVGIVGGGVLVYGLNSDRSNSDRPAGCDEALQSMEAYSQQVDVFNSQPSNYTAAAGSSAMEGLAARLTVAAEQATDSAVRSALQKLATEYSTAAYYVQTDYSGLVRMEPTLQADWDAVIAVC